MVEPYILESLKEFIETKESVLNTECNYLRTPERVDEFLYEVVDSINNCDFEIQKAFVTVALSESSDDYDYCKELKKVNDLLNICKDFKIYDKVSVGYSNELKKRYRMNLDKYLEVIKYAFSEDVYQKLITKNIKELSPNVIILLLQKPHLLKSIGRKNINRSNFVKLFKNNKTKIDFLNEAAKIQNDENETLKKIEGFFEENKTKLLKNDLDIYFSFISAMSLVNPEKYDPKEIMEFFFDVFINNGQHGLSREKMIHCWLNIALSHLATDHFKEAWKEISSKYKIIGYEKKFIEDKQYNRPAVAIELHNNATESLKSKTKMIDEYLIYKCMKNVGMPPYSPYSFSTYTITNKELESINMTKKGFLADIMDINEDASASSWKNGLSILNGHWNYSANVLSQLMPLKEWMYLKSKYSRFFVRQEIRQSSIQNRDGTDKYVFNGYMIDKQILNLLSLYLELAEPDLTLNEELRELLEMNFKI